MARIEGTKGADDLKGTAQDDVMMMKAGRDIARGGAGADVIHGGEGGDTLYGQQGADTLYGDAGNDLLYGGDGRDVLIGGAGANFLSGGAGADRFVFRSSTEDNVGGGSQATAQIDDFSRAENDRIDLSAVDADTTVAGNQAFHFIGEGQLTYHPGEVAFQRNGSSTMISADVDGDGYSDLSIALTGNHNLAASDFLL
jgi:Ca2+-binding RTX toxin-like protein